MEDDFLGCEDRRNVQGGLAAKKTLAGKRKERVGGRLVAEGLVDAQSV